MEKTKKIKYFNLIIVIFRKIKKKKKKLKTEPISKLKNLMSFYYVAIIVNHKHTNRHTHVCIHCIIL